MTASIPETSSDADLTQIDADPTQIEETRRGDLLVGFAIGGRYRVEQMLGEGGMGRVYEVTDLAFKRRAVLKTLLPHLSDRPELFRRFLREARSAAGLGSPHIVGVSDFGMLADRHAYYVMEHVDGVTLEATLTERRGPLPVWRALEIARGITRGVDAAHRAGVIHRDLKPENIILCARRGRADFVKILDFGLALVAGEKGRITGNGQLIGTPHYMAPEQCSEHPVDHRADLYAIGVLLYEMLTFELPYGADSLPQVLRQKLLERPPPPSSHQGCEHIPADVEALVMRLLEREPEARFASAGELMDALDAILGPESSPDAMLAISGEVTASGERPLSRDPWGAPFPPPPSSGAQVIASPAAPADRGARPARRLGRLTLGFLAVLVIVSVASAAVGWWLAHPG